MNNHIISNIDTTSIQQHFHSQLIAFSSFDVPAIHCVSVEAVVEIQIGVDSMAPATPEKKQVGFFEIFKFSTILERFLILLSVAGSIGMGIMMPIFTVFYFDIFYLFPYLFPFLILLDLHGKHHEQLLS